MQALRISVVVLSILCASATCAQAQCCLSSLCPFGCHGCKSDPEATVTQVADRGTGLQSPAVLTKVGSGTKRFMNGTMNLLSFKKPTEKRAAPQSKYSFRRDNKQPGFFYKLFHPAPPPAPRTIKEWMSLEQIHP